MLAELSIDTRRFIKTHYDFLKSKLLNGKEKLVFIILKSFAGAKNECHPSLDTIADLADLCKRTVQSIIKSLENKHVITVKHRKKENGGYTSNLYILYDRSEIWEADTDEERKKIKESIQEMEYINILESKGYKITKQNDENTKPTQNMSDEELINLLKTKGYKITNESDKNTENISTENIEQNKPIEEITAEPIENKVIDIKEKNNAQKDKYIAGNEKEPEKIVAPYQSKTNSSSFQINYNNNCITDLDKCQVKEAYPLDKIRQFFNYSEMLNEYPIYKKEIDTAFNVIYDVVNTRKPIIKIGSEDKPSSIVISKFMKLTKEYIIYAMSKFRFNTTKIKYQISYMRTLLYNAAEQYELEKQNNESMERISIHDI